MPKDVFAISCNFEFMYNSKEIYLLFLFQLNFNFRLNNKKQRPSFQPKEMQKEQN